jgi:hypothetical protein
MKNLNEAKYGFWGTLARKAKSFLDEDCSPEQYKSPRDDVHVGVQVRSAILLPLSSSLIEQWGAKFKLIKLLICN